MTREEAIHFLLYYKSIADSDHNRIAFWEQDKKALDVAIEALSAIDDIKAEMREYRDNFILANRHDLAAVAETCLMFIDNHISGKENE